ncbi:MAG TPA: TnsA endonuclease N-terminal domain-containing protein [Acidobacteriaceae bacterium]|nr:TnsA endonuclease N-terminal domain-containing protein [Acidobacteriaceae bacterium]
MNGNLEWESPHELNALRILDCDPKIASFYDQPCEIVYVQAGEQRRHYPDILVEFAFNGRKEIWEVKTETEASRPEVASRTALMAEHLPAWGYQYRIAVASELSLQPRLRNSCKLLDFGRNSISEDAREKIRRAVAAGENLDWLSACAGKYGPRGREVLCRLALEGYLQVEMNSEWSKETRFSVAAGARW